jgi:hypothetical protein
MEEYVLAGRGPLEGRRIVQVARDQAHALALESLRPAGGAYQGRHLGVSAPERLDQVASHEPGRARDQHLHSGRS